MRTSALFVAVLTIAGAVLAGSAQAQQVTRPAGTKKAANGYHRTSNTKTKARSGAYARYDRSNRRDEENLKLAPGLRLNMPSPPTTDYMGRPLKKKAPKPATTGATSISSEKPAAPAKKTTVKRR
ncbi:hypothetical protein KBK19_03465 [Microvirga sp. STR05]|uniref:Uncharacterized protein n=1 Tax=Hymenobacter duratus TaxID=2771356 RepID=A0ABR8JEL5_9BACT|nr:hypothetical protein [Hymenobacter duratus]MBD2714088.1 hypothetical protein [Hymenobacter duratus]MBR7948990.1 hypothetical protein [Microvirga sp. STR05]